MQNEPNPQNTKTNLTPFAAMSYTNNPPHPTQKNKPNSNPIKPNPPAEIDKTNPIQTEFKPNPTPTPRLSPQVPAFPKLPTYPKLAIRHPLHAARCPTPSCPKHQLIRLPQKGTYTPLEQNSRPSTMGLLLKQEFCKSSVESCITLHLWYNTQLLRQLDKLA